MAITLSYLWPVTGGTPPASSATPPNIPTSSVKFNEVAIDMVGDGSAVSVVATHNLELTPAELAAGFPEVRFEPIVAGAPSGFYVSAKATNTVTVGFNSATFVGTYGILRIARPQRTTL